MRVRVLLRSEGGRTIIGSRAPESTSAVFDNGNNVTAALRGMKSVAAEMAAVTSGLHSSCDETAARMLQDLAHELAAMIGHEPNGTSVTPAYPVRQLKAAVAAAVTAANFYSGTATGWHDAIIARFRPVSPLSTSIDRVLGALPAVDLALVENRGGDSARRVTGQKSSVNDDWHPMGNRQAAFERVLRSTPCAFARQSKVWLAPHIDEIHSAHARETLRRTLRGFTGACQLEPIDGFLITLPPEFGSTVDRLAETTKQMVELLSSQSTAKLWRRHPSHHQWHLRYNGHRYFMLTMAPCYPRDHSRHAFGAAQTFILLQPDAAFDRAVRHQDLGLISPTVRTSIRRKYEDNGQPYDTLISESPVEAHRFVKPLWLGQEPVRWWE